MMIVIKCVFVINILFISKTISDKSIKKFRQPDNLNNAVGDYMEYPQADQETLIDQSAKFKQLQMMAESRSRKELQLSNESIKEQTDKLNDSFTWQSQWPSLKVKLGAVSAVTFDPNNNVVIFHRCDRVWHSQSFSVDNIFSERDKGVITDNTVVAYNRKTGEVLYEWGKNLFFMPHGLTIDHEYNLWITDVALHQVMKFSSTNQKIDKNPLLVLGTAFKPGNGRDTFCKPTSVAILPNGDFFVADGYCNARIVKFSKTGNRILTWGENSFQGKAIAVAPENFFAVPHGLTLAMDKELICVADRENGRVQCFHTSNGTFHSQYHNPVIGDRLFSVSYTPINGGLLYVINGPVVSTYHKVSGFVIEMSTGKVISKFRPNNSEFSNPHDIVVSKDGNEVYVAELSPNKVHKFILTSIDQQNLKINDMAISNADQVPTITSPINQKEKGTTGLIVLTILSITLLLIFGIVLVMTRRRKRGCLSFGMSYRRHAWDFPSGKQEGFKLGSLLDRKRGFEKLNQDASDEEPNVTTNMLSNPQFA